MINKFIDNNLKLFDRNIMRAVIQRVKEAEVIVNNVTCGKINKGLLVFLGIGINDSDDDINYLCEKIINMRLFDKDEKECEISVNDIKGEILIVSQFTLYADVRKGRRPSFSSAMDPKSAEIIYNRFLDKIKDYGLKIEKGIFQAMMDVRIINDGPFTILLDSNKIF